MIRVSQGTASVCGLKKGILAAAPTTASIMIGEHCKQNCGFCAQSRSSQGKAGYLSRVPWPEFPKEEVISALVKACADKVLHRVCLQVICTREAMTKAKDFIRSFREQSSAPVSISCKVNSLEEIAELLDLGVERIGLALDAATPELYRKIKGGNFKEKTEFLFAAAQRFPDHIATHLIVGLGETEEEMIRLIQQCYANGVRVGLFAFTPIRGTLMEKEAPPAMDQYRRVQLARYILADDYHLGDKFVFQSGRLFDYGLSKQELADFIGEGTAFRTSGCPNCNRPFYNDRPGTHLFNYPQPLQSEELARAWKELKLGGLAE